MAKGRSAVAMGQRAIAEGDFSGAFGFTGEDCIVSKSSQVGICANDVNLGASVLKWNGKSLEEALLKTTFGNCFQSDCRRVECGENEGCNKEPHCASVFEDYPVFCCSETALTMPLAQKHGAECPYAYGQLKLGFTDPDPSKCVYAANFGKAEAVCAAAGARSCTVSEIRAGCATELGCGSDNMLVWTSDSGKRSQATVSAGTSCEGPATTGVQTLDCFDKTDELASQNSKVAVSLEHPVRHGANFTVEFNMVLTASSQDAEVLSTVFSLPRDDFGVPGFDIQAADLAESACGDTESHRYKILVGSAGWILECDGVDILSDYIWSAADYTMRTEDSIVLGAGRDVQCGASGSGCPRYHCRVAATFGDARISYGYNSEDAQHVLQQVGAVPPRAPAAPEAFAGACTAERQAEVYSLDPAPKVVAASSRYGGTGLATYAHTANLLQPNPKLLSVLGNGDIRFLFGDDADTNQYVILDLGQPVPLSRIGTSYSTTDRAVWDTVSFETSMTLDGDYTAFNRVGAADGIQDIYTSATDSGFPFTELGGYAFARFIKYSYGKHWNTGLGSGLRRVWACMQTELGVKHGDDIRA